jgi:hypothetical protein
MQPYAAKSDIFIATHGKKRKLYYCEGAIALFLAK